MGWCIMQPTANQAISPFLLTTCLTHHNVEPKAFAVHCRSIDKWDIKHQKWEWQNTHLLNNHKTNNTSQEAAQSVRLPGCDCLRFRKLNSDVFMDSSVHGTGNVRNIGTRKQAASFRWTASIVNKACGTGDLLFARKKLMCQKNSCVL